MLLALKANSPLTGLHHPSSTTPLTLTRPALLRCTILSSRHPRMHAVHP